MIVLDWCDLTLEFPSSTANLYFITMFPTTVKRIPCQMQVMLTLT